METTTSAIKQKLLEDQKGRLLEVAREMRASGASNDSIRRMVQNHITLKAKLFYQKKQELSGVSDCIRDACREITGTKADSKAEMIFDEMLRASGVKFQFQYRIGPYRADYLVGDNLVVELDGPLHKRKASIDHDQKRDAYMIGKGYHIVRLDLNLVALDPKAAIEGIKELIQ